MADETDGPMSPKPEQVVKVEVPAQAQPVPVHYSTLDRVANVAGKVASGLAGLLFIVAMGIATIGGPEYPGSNHAKYSKQSSAALYASLGTGLLGAGLIKYSRRHDPKPKKEERQGLRG